MIAALFIVAVLQTTPTSPTLEWYYPDADRGDVFLICVDSQPTASCAKVLRTSVVQGTTTADGPIKTYTFKLPTLPFGSHTAVVQTCTLDAHECSPGVRLTFTVTAAMSDVRGLRIIGGK